MEAVLFAAHLVWGIEVENVQLFSPHFNRVCSSGCEFSWFCSGVCLRWHGLSVVCFDFIYLACMVRHVVQVCSYIRTWLAQHSFLSTLISYSSLVILEGFAGLCSRIFPSLGATVHPVWQGSLPLHYQGFHNDLVSTEEYSILFVQFVYKFHY